MPFKSGKSGKKSRGKNFNRAPINGNKAHDVQQRSGPGVCIKCGHPAPDGKLCSFHRSLLNSIRNDHGKRSGRSNAPFVPAH